MPTKHSIRVCINGQNHFFPDTVFLKDVFTNLKIDLNHIAVALNEEVIPRSEVSAKTVKDGDHIEIVRAVAGG